MSGPGIFLSYRREDAAEDAGRLHESLTRHFDDLPIFIDVDSLEPGDDFVDAIADTLTHCRVVLAVIGPRWSEATNDRGERRLDEPDDFVRFELETALNRAVPVIPVLVQGARMPTAAELPSSLADLPRRQAVELHDRLWPESLRALLATLERLVGPDAGERPGSPERGARHNLPTPATSFVGRHRERAEVRDLLGESRVVTLVGAGGVGKTRLALETAGERLNDPHDGVWLVELAALADPELVAPAVASVLGVRQQPGRPLVETLVDAFSERTLVIVLDNCEHVLDATARLADHVTRACPTVTILATSREPLGIAGERVYRLPSMAVPPQAAALELAGLVEYEAIQLLTDRAARHAPGFVIDVGNAKAVVSVCRRLDGIPLAIELAAARLRSLTIDEIDQRLDQRFRLLRQGSRAALPRQQTLRALVGWSYDLLDERERTVLCRLAVFAGGWDLEAAEAVVSDTELIEDYDVVELLAGLVDKSLVQAEPRGATTRYGLLDTIRHYAAEQLALDERDGERTRRRHREYYLALAEAAAPQLHGCDQTAWFRQLDLEHDNLRAALTTCRDDPDAAEVGFRFVRALQDFWCHRGLAAEGVEHATVLLERSETSSPTAAHAAALVAAALFHQELSEFEAARALAEQAVAIAGLLDDHAISSDALRVLTHWQCRHEEIAAARRTAEQALQHARETGDRHLMGLRLRLLGHMTEECGEPDAARPLYHEALELFRAEGNDLEAATVLNNLAGLEIVSGHLDTAATMFEEIVTTARDVHDDPLLAMARLNLGLVAIQRRDARAAFQHLSESLRLSWQCGLQELIAIALSNSAVATSLSGDWRRAAALHGAAGGLVDRLGTHLPPDEQALAADDQAQLRAEMGTEIFDSAYEHGRGLTVRDAITLATFDPVLE